jgi:CheY-like chemotaxis protein
MNAVIGYGSLLMAEADELGITALLPEIQRLHTAAKNLVDHIDRLLPSGPEASQVDIDAIRPRVHEALLHPATDLLQHSERLLAKAGSSAGAFADLQRQNDAARKLLAFVQDLALPANSDSATSGARFEHVFNRLYPTSQQTNLQSAAGTLLVVDDNVANRELLTRQLVHEGYGVFSAASGKEALEKLRLHDFDLVFLDVIMPEMDGIEVLEHMQGDAALADIPVVMTSALDQIDAVARCIERGAVDYFAKPFDPVLLRARVSATLQIHRLKQDLRRAEGALGQSHGFIDELVKSVVPRPLSEGLQRGERSLSVQYPEVTAVVARVEGLDAIASRSSPEETIACFNNTVGIFERCSKDHGFEIVRLSERSYTAVSGAPEWRENHPQLAADYALDVLQAMQKSSEGARDRPEIRIGVNTGTLIAAVAGAERLTFGMWGDAVSTADALAQQAPVGKIHVSAATCAKLHGKFELGSPSVVEVPGHGHLRAYVLAARKSSSAAD